LTWHRQLELEVNDTRQRIPWIADKLQSELIEIKKIDDALKETEHELSLSRAKNADTLDKSIRANQRATIEREQIRSEMDKALKAVQRITFVFRVFPCSSFTSSCGQCLYLVRNLMKLLINIERTNKRLSMPKKQ
jgi:septal ring factor EnvC (AmiA/AmiB activator)